MELEEAPRMASDKRPVSLINKSLAAFAVWELIYCTSFALEAQSMERKSSDHQQTEAQSINASDGISQAEAIVIARNIVVEKGISKSCKISRPKVKDSTRVENCWSVEFPANWKVRLKQGLVFFSVDVDKKTGEMKAWGWEPS